VAVNAGHTRNPALRDKPPLWQTPPTARRSGPGCFGRGSPHAAALRFGRHESVENSPGECGRVPGIGQIAVHAGFDDVGRPAMRRGDDRGGGRERLNQHQSERFIRGRAEEQVGGGVIPKQFLIGQAVKPMDGVHNLKLGRPPDQGVAVGFFVRRGLFRADRNQKGRGFADFAQGLGHPRNGLDQLEKAFAGVEPADREQQVIGGESELALKLGLVQAQVECFRIHTSGNDPNLLAIRAVVPGQRVLLGSAERDDGVGRIQDFFRRGFERHNGISSRPGWDRQYGPVSGALGSGW